MGDVWIVVAHYRSTKNTSVSRICRFKSSRHCFGRVGSTPTATIPWLKRKTHMFSENQAYEVENKQDCEIVDSQ